MSKSCTAGSFLKVGITPHQLHGGLLFSLFFLETFPEIEAVKDFHHPALAELEVPSPMGIPGKFVMNASKLQFQGIWLWACGKVAHHQGWSTLPLPRVTCNRWATGAEDSRARFAYPKDGLVKGL